MVCPSAPEVSFESLLLIDMRMRKSRQLFMRDCVGHRPPSRAANGCSNHNVSWIPHCEDAHAQTSVIQYRGETISLRAGAVTESESPFRFRFHGLASRGEGSTEKAQVVRSLLSELIDRGLAADAARLWMIDGGKALRRAIVNRFGSSALIQRCQEHKRRNVLDHLPDEPHASVGRAMRDAWETKDHTLAKRQLERLAHSLSRSHPGAASSVREGLEETLTLIELGIEEALYRTFRTTNPIENLNGRIAHHTRNVSAGETARWCFAGSRTR